MQRSGPWMLVATVIVVASAVATALMIKALRPTLARYALARPNARSSHRVPTPQGGGIAIVAVASVVMIVISVIHPAWVAGSRLGVVLGAMVVLAVVGAADDIITLRALPRLVWQVLASAAVIAVIPAELRALPWLPLVIERLVLVLAVVWFVNLVNFMDGIDWITVAEVVPICAGLCVLGALGKAPPVVALTALTLGGATCGFAPFNRPVAGLFLGDVGSLPIGLLIAWMLVNLAGVSLCAAILLPLYYLADATITLGRRLARGERVWEAHRTHFYQRATDHGFSVLQIVSRVFLVNLGLGALAVMAAMGSSLVAASALTAGALLVGTLLLTFSRRRA